MKRRGPTKQAGDPGTSNRPWVSNYPPLKEWLDKIGARPMWQLPQPAGTEGDDVQAYVEGWMASGRVFILQVWRNRMGWELYTADGGARLDESFADAEKRLAIGEIR